MKLNYDEQLKLVEYLKQQHKPTQAMLDLMSMETFIDYMMKSHPDLFESYNYRKDFCWDGEDCFRLDFTMKKGDWDIELLWKVKGEIFDYYYDFKQSKVPLFINFAQG